MAAGTWTPDQSELTGIPRTKGYPERQIESGSQSDLNFQDAQECHWPRHSDLQELQYRNKMMEFWKLTSKTPDEQNGQRKGPAVWFPELLSQYGFSRFPDVQTGQKYRNWEDSRKTGRSRKITRKTLRFQGFRNSGELRMWYDQQLEASFRNSEEKRHWMSRIGYGSTWMNAKKEEPDQQDMTNNQKCTEFVGTNLQRIKKLSNERTPKTEEW